MSANAISYSEAARRAGYDVSHVSRVMRGKRRPSVEALRRLSTAYGMSTDRLLKRLSEVANAPQTA